MSVVYVVTAGSYSDYHILAVFTSRRRAQEYVRQFKRDWDKPRIESYDLDIPKAEWTITYVRMRKDGSVEETYLRTNGGYDGAGLSCFDIRGGMLWGVATADEERAIKVVNEKRAQVLAAGTWGKDGATRRLIMVESERCI